MGLFGRKKAATAPTLHAAPTPEGIPKPPPKDERIAACPYCGVELKKVPGAATKCPSCHLTMYVRTDQKTRVRRVVTNTEADLIDDRNEAYALGDLARFLRRVERKTAELRKKFGQEPAYSDVRWGLLNEDLLTHAGNRNFGLYRNTRWKMMQMLSMSGKTKQALDTALEVFYMDSCNPNNLSDSRGSSARAWGPSEDFGPGYLSDFIGSWCETLGITPEQAAIDFAPRAEKLKANLHMSRAWSAVWKKSL